MAKIFDNIGTVLYAFGADVAAYNMWLKAFRIRQNSGELDQED